mgnify:FL=1
MKIKTIEEIHKILKQKAIKSASVKVDFNSKMTEKYCTVWWQDKATIEEKNEYEQLSKDWNKYSALLREFEENEF